MNFFLIWSDTLQIKLIHVGGGETLLQGRESAPPNPGFVLNSIHAILQEY